MFFRKKKPAIPTKNEIQEILRATLTALPRTEGAEVAVGVVKPDDLPCAFIKKPGRTFREDLGGDGEVALIYNAEEKELSLRLTYCYAQNSGEMELLADCLQSFATEEDALPGDVCGFRISHLTDAPKTHITLFSDGVEPTELRECAARLCDFVNDWLDTNYEVFEDMWEDKDAQERLTERASVKQKICGILVDALASLPRLEGARVEDCFTLPTYAPMAKVERLGHTLREDLGGDGEVSLSYDLTARELTLTLQYAYPLESREMVFILKQLDSFDEDEDAESFPGSIDRIDITRYTTDDIAEVFFVSEQIDPTDVEEAVARLLDRVNDWLDVTYELIEDLC